MTIQRFREQASNFKAQVTLAEEREKLRESEANTKNSMLIKKEVSSLSNITIAELLGRVRSLEEIEANLRRHIIRLEEEKSDIIRKVTHQVAPLFQSNNYQKNKNKNERRKKRETKIKIYFIIIAF